eukprot:472199-Prymnesium_polylepis.2
MGLRKSGAAALGVPPEAEGGGNPESEERFGCKPGDSTSRETSGRYHVTVFYLTSFMSRALERSLHFVSQTLKSQVRTTTAPPTTARAHTPVSHATGGPFPVTLVKS